MRKVDVAVIGGSAAGIAAAVTCGRHYPDKSILLITKDRQVPIPCGIPYIFGTIGDPAKNVMLDAGHKKPGMTILGDEVQEIDRDKRVMTTAGGEEISYERLILATGSKPIIPPIPGVEKDNVFAVHKNVPHLGKMLERVNASSRIVVVGGGFIGVEFADECRKGRDVKISIVEMLPKCLMLAFDDELCDVAEEILRKNGIEILAPDKVVEFVGDDAVTGVRLESGKEIPTDMVILGIGASANTELAERAGLETGPTHGIRVNRYMQTGDKNIFACGDCAEKFSFFDGMPSKLKLASEATREARIAGANLFSTRRMNRGVIGTFSTVVDGTAFGLAGLSARGAERKGYDIAVGEAEAPNRHPGSMPGMAALRVKLVFERGTGIVIGGQIMGARSGGELINTISTCIHEKMTADDIALFPMGTHPALTASPVMYQLTNAAEMAIKAIRSS
ncbi:MAG: pyridine nucleotide-disulfide oxidoreductase [Candidatus Coatesbacteria bacterium]|nr:MAG: pyridine nucleotide-disulfide oxidoreductase [Candidatus Coatesbacteria bacterium]